MKRLDVAIIVIVTGILAAIATPNYIEGRRRSRQYHTLADMRSIAMALEARAVDLKSYAIGAASAELRAVPWPAVERALTPTYSLRLPRTDAWKHPFTVYVSDQHYAIRSLGSDGRAEGQRYVRGDTTRFEDDLVFADGNFIRAPGGL
jgi:Tfp pilus assembly protein PilE